MTPGGRLGRIGIWSSAWSSAFRSGDAALIGAVMDAAAELDELGYGTLWIGQSPSIRYAEPLLDATRRVTVATGVMNIRDYQPASAARHRAELERLHPGRFLLGLGVSHGEFSPRYAHPYAAVQRYLSGLDTAHEPVPSTGRVLAALGPKMLALARDRAAGAHPYLVTAEHIAAAREILGPDALLAPEFTVVLDEDLARAAGIARGFLSGHLAMSNYTASLARIGFGGDDFRGGGSDRLIDALFAIGTLDDIAAKIPALFAAGADHVAVQVVTRSRRRIPLPEWRQLATILPVDSAEVPGSATGCPQMLGRHAAAGVRCVPSEAERIRFPTAEQRS
jgi:probable F420-dependent oxidoreductase